MSRRKSRFQHNLCFSILLGQVGQVAYEVRPGTPARESLSQWQWLSTLPVIRSLSEVPPCSQPKSIKTARMLRPRRRAG
jgi:hypothetical protein